MKIKKALFVLALAPLFMFAATVRADDDLLNQVADLQVENIADSEIAIDEFDLSSVDVDGLAEDAKEDKDEAIEACFRRVGYGQGYGHSYGYGYNSCYYPSYSYGCNWYSPCYTEYRPMYTYRTCYTTVQYTPVYTQVHAPVCTTVYSQYWGCH